MYPAEFVQPMRDELTAVGFKQLSCAAANARPGVRISLANEKSPSNLVTVFAGVDFEATDRAREMMVPFPPSSPSMALFRNGELVHMLERHHIEGRPAEMIAENLKQAYEEFC